MKCGGLEGVARAAVLLKHLLERHGTGARLPGAGAGIDAGRHLAEVFLRLTAGLLDGERPVAPEGFPAHPAMHARFHNEALGTAWRHAHRKAFQRVVTVERLALRRRADVVNHSLGESHGNPVNNPLVGMCRHYVGSFFQEWDNRRVHHKTRELLNCQGNEGVSNPFKEGQIRSNRSGSNS